MKKFITILLSVICAVSLYAQTAPNFTSTDCAGKQHDLYSELNEGKIIVIVWVMPCVTCISPAMSAYNIVESYQDANPGRIFFYMVDDFGNTSCASLESWANNYSMPVKSFSALFSDVSIDMQGYGSIGMPKIVIVGGADHHIFYNADNQINIQAFTQALNSAIRATGIEAVNSKITPVKFFPNPANNMLSLAFSSLISSPAELIITDLTGKIVLSKNYNTEEGENEVSVEVSSLAAGVYLAHLIIDGYEQVNKIVVHK